MKLLHIRSIAVVTLVLSVVVAAVRLLAYLHSPILVGEPILRQVLGQDRFRITVDEAGAEWTMPATYVFAVSSTNWIPTGLEPAERYPKAYEIAEDWVKFLLPNRSKVLDIKKCRFEAVQVPGEDTITYIIEYSVGSYFVVILR